MQKVGNGQEKNGDKVPKVKHGTEHIFNDQKLKQEEKNTILKN